MTFSSSAEFVDFFFRHRTVPVTEAVAYVRADGSNLLIVQSVLETGHFTATKQDLAGKVIFIAEHLSVPEVRPAAAATDVSAVAHGAERGVRLLAGLHCLFVQLENDFSFGFLFGRSAQIRSVQTAGLVDGVPAVLCALTGIFDRFFVTG